MTTLLQLPFTLREHFPVEEITHKNHRIAVRQGTSDSFVVKEVWGGEYSKLQIMPTDIVVDFGMNIGMFSLYARQRGAKQVIGYEPEEDNYNIACYNIQQNGQTAFIQAHKKAIVGNQDVVRNFSINGKKNKGAHSLVAKRGRSTVAVDCVNVDSVIQQYRPSIIKMDIEGGEMECLPAITDWSSVNQLILEFHHAHLNDTADHKKYNQTLAMLRQHFSSVQARADTKGAWVNIIFCKK